MPFIVFLGCDGSGKSAVIKAVAAHLEASGCEVTLGHWRPKPFASTGKVNSSAADDPHGQPPRGLTASVFKLGWLWLNWWLAWFQTLRHGCRRGYLIFDRYHGDLLVDPKRYRYGGPVWLAVLASRWMPQPDRAKKLSLRFKKTHNNFSPSPGTQGSKSLIAISYLDSQPLLS